MSSSGAPPGLSHPAECIRYSSQELRALGKLVSASLGACPPDMKCYEQVKVRVKEKEKSTTRSRGEKGKGNETLDWRTESGDGRRNRVTHSNADNVKLENLGKIDLPFSQKGGESAKQGAGGRLPRGEIHTPSSKGGGWDDVGTNGGWTNSNARAGIGGRGAMTAADKLRLFEQERQEILSQRSGAEGTPLVNKPGAHLQQQAAGIEGSYHSEGDTIMALLQAESGQKVKPAPSPAPLAQPDINVSITSIHSSTMSMGGLAGASVWSAGVGELGAASSGADFFSADFFSSSVSLEATPIVETDSDVKRSRRLKSWLSTLAGEEENSEVAEQPSATSRMSFATEGSPLRGLPPPAPVVNDGPRTPPSSPQKTTKLSLNSLFSMAAKNEDSQLNNREDCSVKEATDVMAKLGFSGQDSPSRDAINREHPSGGPVIAASLGPPSPLLQPPSSPFAFTIHRVAPPGMTPGLESGSAGVNGGIASPPPKSSSQPRSASKGVNVSASSRLLIQQQKNKRQQMQKQNGANPASPPPAPSSSQVSNASEVKAEIKFGDVNAAALVHKKSEVSVAGSVPTSTNESISQSRAGHAYNLRGAGQGKQTGSDSSSVTVAKVESTQNSAPLVSSVNNMKKISINSLFAGAAAARK